MNNGMCQVSADTQAKVPVTFEELGYKLNQLTKCLARKNTLAIALIVPNTSAHWGGFNDDLLMDNKRLPQVGQTISCFLQKGFGGKPDIPEAAVVMREMQNFQEFPEISND